MLALARKGDATMPKAFINTLAVRREQESMAKVGRPFEAAELKAYREYSRRKRDASDASELRSIRQPSIQEYQKHNPHFWLREGLIHSNCNRRLKDEAGEFVSASRAHDAFGVSFSKAKGARVVVRKGDGNFGLRNK